MIYIYIYCDLLYCDIHHLTLNFDVKFPDFPVHPQLQRLFPPTPSSKRAGRPPKARCKDGKGAILDLDSFFNPTTLHKDVLVDVKMDPKGEKKMVFFACICSWKCSIFIMV